MTATGDLTGVRAKIARAHEHACELKAILAPILRETEASIVMETDGPSKLAFRAMNVPEIDGRWAAIAGDCLHNLRSALDHLAWQLVILDGGTPNMQTQFPIHEFGADSNGAPRDLTIKPGIARSDILQCLQEVQPYTGVQHGHQAHDSTLWTLNELSRIDKHRLLLTMTHSINGEEPGWWGLPAGVKSPRFSYRIEPIESGDIVAWFDFGDGHAPPEFDPHVALAVSVAEGPPHHWMRLRRIDELLENLVGSVAHHITWPFIGRLFPSEIPIIVS